MREDNEICPKCGSPGYSYSVPSSNSPYKNGPRNWYTSPLGVLGILTLCLNRNVEISMS